MASRGLWKMFSLPTFILTTDGTIDFVKSGRCFIVQMTLLMVRTYDSMGHVWDLTHAVPPGACAWNQ